MNPEYAYNATYGILACALQVRLAVSPTARNGGLVMNHSSLLERVAHPLTQNLPRSGHVVVAPTISRRRPGPRGCEHRLNGVDENRKEPKRHKLGLETRTMENRTC